MGYLNAPWIGIIFVAEKDFSKVPLAGSCQNAVMRYVWKMVYLICCVVVYAVKSLLISPP